MGSLIGLKSSENALQLHKHPCEMSSLAGLPFQKLKAGCAQMIGFP